MFRSVLICNAGIYGSHDIDYHNPFTMSLPVPRLDSSRSLRKCAGGSLDADLPIKQVHELLRPNNYVFTTHTQIALQ